jgi:M6 family metalloprotease-like protein
VAPSVGVLRAALLLVHAADAPREESVAPPQELIDAAADWFRTVSYGRLDFRVETVPRWLALPRRSPEYVADPGRHLADAVAAADPYVDFSKIDVVYLAPASRTPETATSALLNGFGVRADGKEIRLWIPFGAGFASVPGGPENLLHETGHLLGLPDLYVARSPGSFHRWDLMAARWPAELLAWHRWKLGWLDGSQIVCLTGRATRTVTLSPLGRPGGTKALLVKRGRRVLVVEVRARTGYDRTLCETGVLVYEVDQTPFRRAPVRLYVAGGDSRPPGSACGACWNALFDVGRGEVPTLSGPGLGVDVLARRADGSYRVRVSAASSGGTG